MRHLRSWLLLGAALCGGCSIKQDVVRVQSKPESLCVVEHKAVREGVLAALQEGFGRHRIPVRVIDGTYELRGKHWYTSWQPENAQGCDAVVTYVANWTWDLRMYMVYANVTMLEPAGKEVMASADYDATKGGASLEKFIDAREKIIELVDQMITGQPSPAKK